MRAEDGYSLRGSCLVLAVACSEGLPLAADRGLPHEPSKLHSNRDAHLIVPAGHFPQPTRDHYESDNPYYQVAHAIIHQEVKYLVKNAQAAHDTAHPKSAPFSTTTKADYPSRVDQAIINSKRSSVENIYLLNVESDKICEDLVAPLATGSLNKVDFKSRGVNYLTGTEEVAATIVQNERGLFFSDQEDYRKLVKTICFLIVEQADKGLQAWKSSTVYANVVGRICEEIFRRSDLSVNDKQEAYRRLLKSDSLFLNRGQDFQKRLSLLQSELDRLQESKTTVQEIPEAAARDNEDDNWGPEWPGEPQQVFTLAIDSENWTSKIRDKFEEYQAYYIKGSLALKPLAHRIRTDSITDEVVKEWLPDLSVEDKNALEFIAILAEQDQEDSLENLISVPARSGRGQWTTNRDWRAPDPTRHKRPDAQNKGKGQKERV